MLQSQQPHLFDADDHPRCPACGGQTSLIRRTRHPDYGLAYDQQTFVCLDCRHQSKRNADARGQPHG